MSALLSSAVNATKELLFAVLTMMESLLHFMHVILELTTERPYLLVFLLLAAAVVYYSSFPYDKNVDFTEIGYDYLRPKGGKGSQDLSMKVHQKDQWRDRGEVPPVYPNGWIPLLESRDLLPEQCKPVTALGQEFVVFRGKAGKAFILDAYCPHLGAHLGVEGKVEGDCIQCPFHGWKFSGPDGSCVEIPYTDKIPGVAKIKTWETIEQNGFIYFWYHAEGHSPSWVPPVVPKIARGVWKYIGRLQYTSNCHIQEVIENGADENHFIRVHQAPFFARNKFFPGFEWNFCRHVWTMLSWSIKSEPDQHMNSIKLKNTFKFFGITLPTSDELIEILQIGPAIVHIYFNIMLFKGMFTFHVTPELPFRQKIIVQLYLSSGYPQILSSIMLRIHSNMLKRDILVWNNKKFLKSPLLLSEDKTIAKFRKWYSQFYSENSPRFTKNTLEW